MSFTVLRSLSLVLALSVTCCGSPPSAVQDASTPLDDAETPAPAPTEPEGCGMVFSPVPELIEATESAAARWSAATGCDVRVGEGGLTVTLEQSIPRPDGTEAPGGTERVNGEPTRVMVHERGDDWSRTVLHEMGHALGADGHTTEDGVMSNTKGYTPIINAASLELLCSFRYCPAFVPEG